MENENLYFKILLKKFNLEEINLEKIPEIDLYMDQITTFFDEMYFEHKRYEKDSILTKTMINNYAKTKILLPIVKKKYSKVQIVLLIIIYKLKQNLSIEDIKKVLNPILNLINMEPNKYSKLLLEIYENFLNLKRDLLIEDSLLLNKIQNIKYKNDELEIQRYVTSKLLTILIMATKANLYKKTLEGIIDE